MANGKDRGSFAVDLTRFAPAAEKLMRLQRLPRGSLVYAVEL